VLAYFSKIKPQIAEAIKNNLLTYAEAYQKVSVDLGRDAALRLIEFALRGKMLRGCLVRLGFELVKGREPSELEGDSLSQAAAAVELFQSGLLVHDDIMDRDRVRRGHATLHVGYETTLASGSYDDPQHYGEALAICAGDLAYFAAFSMLASLPSAKGAGSCAIASRELALVGIAQMQDVVNGAVRKTTKNTFRTDFNAEPSHDDILSLYRYKTGRYTFSMPLALGADLADADLDIKQGLEKAGEALGLLFQLKDDELGLFADEVLLGKSVGADIRENKKTLFRLKLFERADSEQKTKLFKIFGNHEASTEDLDYVTTLIEVLGVRSEMDAIMQRYALEALESLQNLLKTSSPLAAQTYRELVAYSLERNS